MVIVRYDVSGNSQCCSVVVTVGNRRAGMLNCSEAILVTSSKHETPVKKPTQQCMSGTVIGLELHGILEQGNRGRRVLCHLGEKRWQHSQYNIVGAEVVGPFAS